MVEGGGQSEGLITTGIDPIHSEEAKKGTEDSILCHEFDSIFVEYFPD